MIISYQVPRMALEETASEEDEKGYVGAEQRAWGAGRGTAGGVQGGKGCHFKLRRASQTSPAE